MPDYREILARIVSDPRYLANLDWGAPRHGHPEATIRAHIIELLTNLDVLASAVVLSHEVYWKLAILIHVHDTFKRESHERRPGRHAPMITDPDSHASIARAFLSEFTDDWPLLATVQFHDEPYALWRKAKRGSPSVERSNLDARFRKLIDAIPDWDLFTAFVIIDGTTAGKSQAAQEAGLTSATEPRDWFLSAISEHVTTRWTKETVELMDTPRVARARAWVKMTRRWAEG